MQEQQDKSGVKENENIEKDERREENKCLKHTIRFTDHIIEAHWFGE